MPGTGRLRQEPKLILRVENGRRETLKSLEKDAGNTKGKILRRLEPISMFCGLLD